VVYLPIEGNFLRDMRFSAGTAGPAGHSVRQPLSSSPSIFTAVRPPLTGQVMTAPSNILFTRASIG